jgi:hypothetical protein
MRALEIPSLEQTSSAERSRRSRTSVFEGTTTATVGMTDQSVIMGGFADPVKLAQAS